MKLLFIGGYAFIVVVLAVIVGLRAAGVAALQTSHAVDLAAYVLKKLLLTIPLLLGVITLIFILIELSPGTVVDKFITPDTTPEIRERLVAKWHLDDPAPVRYVHMIGNLATLDFGVSMDQERPVFDIIADALPNTLLLSTIGLLTLYPVGLTLGSIQAVRRGRPEDTLLSIVTLFLYSMPVFWFAMMLQLVFTYKWPILPSSGMKDAVMFDYMTTGEQWKDRFEHILLPGVGVGLASAAGVARYMRSSLLEVIQLDYVRTARAKGLPERVVILRHALRNALLPIITLMGLSLPYLFSGSVLVETIFAWPGMGRVIVSAIFAQDTPLIIACFFVFTLIVVIGNVLADVSYAFVDPRIRLDR
jgi:peptide/nickel transport system permease protein